MNPKNFPDELQGIEISLCEQSGAVGPVDWRKYDPLFRRYNDCRVRSERIGNIAMLGYLRELLAKHEQLPLLKGLLDYELGGAITREQFDPMKAEIDQLRLQSSKLEPELRIFLSQMELLISDAEWQENPIEIG